MLSYIKTALQVMVFGFIFGVGQRVAWWVCQLGYNWLRYRVGWDWGIPSSRTRGEDT